MARSRSHRGDVGWGDAVVAAHEIGLRSSTELEQLTDLLGLTRATDAIDAVQIAGLVAEHASPRPSGWNTSTRGADQQAVEVRTQRTLIEELAADPVDLGLLTQEPLNAPKTAFGPRLLYEPPAPQVLLRSAMTALTRRPRRSGEVDVDAAVERIAGELPFTELPLLSELVTGPGLKVVADIGLSMQPYLADVTRFVAEARAVAGTPNVTVVWVRPEDPADAETLAGISLERGRPVLVLSALGAVHPPSVPSVARLRWLAFAAAAQREGVDLVALVPHRINSWPGVIAQGMRVIAWDDLSQPVPPLTRSTTTPLGRCTTTGERQGDVTPEVVALARVASVAAVIEPPLLRRLRLELGGTAYLEPSDSPEACHWHAGTEADLWFSELAHVATSDQLTLRPAVLEILRRQLGRAKYRDAARAARRIVEDAHSSQSEMVQLEERIIWATITGDTSDAGYALERAIATLKWAPERANEVTRWFAQARRRLPLAALEHPAGRRLLAALAMHSDRVVPPELLAADRFPDGVAELAPNGLPITQVAVQILDGTLRFSDPTDLDTGVLDVPDTRPIIIEAKWEGKDGAEMTTVVAADPGCAITLEGLPGEVVLRTLTGRRFRARAVSAQCNLVCIATTDYDFLPRLNGVPEDVRSISDWLTDERLGDRRFNWTHPELAQNPSRGQLLEGLERLSHTPDWKNADAAVVYITGHALVHNGSLWLCVRSTDPRRPASTGVRMADVISSLAETNVGDVMVLVDVCYAGQLRVELPRFDMDLPPSWIVLMSAGPTEVAEDGGLARAISGLLVDHPADHVGPLFGHARYLKVSQFFEAIQARLTRQRPILLSPGSFELDESPCLPNPYFLPDSEPTVVLARRGVAMRPEDVASHWGPSSRGTTECCNVGWLFTGRQALMQQLVQAATGDPGTLILAGGPGTGKSAALARLVALSHPNFREEDRAQSWEVPPGLLPPEGCVDLALLAGGRTPDETLAVLCARLGVANPPVTAAGMREQLLATWSSWLARRESPLTIVVDGVDESTSPTDLVDGVLAHLHGRPDAKRLRLLVGVRTSGSDRSGPSTLVEQLARLPAARVIDAEAAPWWQESDLAEYVNRVLTSLPGSPYGIAPAVVTAEVAHAVAAEVGHSYIAARLAASALAQRLDWVDPRNPNWRFQLRSWIQSLQDTAFPKLVFVGHTGAVTSVAFGVVDGRPVLASASNDKTVRLWDVVTGAPIGQPLVGHTGAVTSVAFGVVDGRPVLVSASNDKTVRLWDVGYGENPVS